MSLLEGIKNEAAVIRGAPFAAVLFGVVGLGVGSWYFSGQVASVKEQLSTVKEQLSAKDAQISRYRVAFGIDKASSGSLIELTNNELRAKALGTAATLHQFCFSFRDRNAQLQKELSNPKLGKKDKAERIIGLRKQESDEFDASGSRSDATLVEVELRRRLSPEAKASILGLPPALRGADGGYLSILEIAGNTGWDAGWVCTVGSGIEEMGKLLPSDGR